MGATSSLASTLQINLAPSDHRHAAHVVPHQLRQWSAQVSEVLLVVDTARSRGRFGTDWDAGRIALERLIASWRQTWPTIRVSEVAYDVRTERRIASLFFGGRRSYSKDFRGGPYYAYLFGLAEAGNDFILHTDSDMLFGGGSQRWLAEAQAMMNDDPSILTVSPLPGPPHPQGVLHAQSGGSYRGRPFTFGFDQFSTRVFAVSRQRFLEALAPLRPRAPKFPEALRAVLRRNPLVELPEETIGRAMRRRGMVRVDFLGSAPGMWSVHPPYRSEQFYRTLPDLIRRVEDCDIPDAQRGYYDVGDALVDWTSARDALRRNAWHRRALSGIIRHTWKRVVRDGPVAP